MRIALLSALLLSSVAAAEEKPSPFELSIEIVPRQPRPGDRVYVLGRLRNTESNHELLVPSDLRSWLHLSAKPDDGIGTGRGLVRGDSPIEWMSFKGQGTIEVAAELGTLTEACRRGCPGGSFIVTLTLDPTHPPQRDGDHFVPPPMQATERINIAPEETPVLSRSEDLTAVRITPLVATRQGQRGVAVKVRLENVTTHPLWVPKPASFTVSSCTVSGPEGGGGMGLGGPPFPRGLSKAKTSDWVLLQPRKTLDLQVLCPFPMQKAGGEVQLEMGAPPADEFASDFRPPFVWWGTRTVGPVRIR